MKLKMTSKKADTIFDVIFTILLFSLPLSMAIPNIALLLLILLFLIKKGKIILSSVYIKLILIFVGFLLLKALFNQTFLENIKVYKHSLTLAILTVLTMNIKNILLVKKGFILGIFTAVIISLTNIVVYYYKHDIIPLGNTSKVSDLLLIHRPYFGFMCVIAVILIDNLKTKLQNRIEYLFYNLITLTLFFFVYLIVARLSLFLMLLFIIIKITRKFNLSKLKLSFIVIIILSSIIISFSINKNLKERFHIKDSFIETIKVLEDKESRFVIWSCAFNQISNPKFNLFFGYNNVKTIQTKLNECYKNNIENQSKKQYYIKKNFNVHNQFYNILLQGGIIGLFLFLSLLGYSFYIFKDNMMSILMILSFSLFLLLENVLDRQIGTYLFAIFVPLMLNSASNLNKSKPQND